MMQTPDGKIRQPRSRRKRRVLVVLSCAALLALALTWWLWPRPEPLYTVTILSAPQGVKAVPQAINDHGRVVGYTFQAPIAGYRLFLWDEGDAMKILNSIAGGRLDINNRGQVAGTMLDPNYAEFAFLREPDGTVRSLGTLGGRASSAEAINNRGQVVGVSETPNGSQHAFLWDSDNGMRDLGTFGELESKAFAINDRGQVFGSSYTRPSRFRTFLWDPNQGMVRVAPSHPSINLCRINSGSWLAGDTWLRKQHCMVLWSPDKGVRTLFPIERAELANPLFGFADRVLLNDANQVAFSFYDQRAFWRVRRRIGGPRQLHFLWDPERGRISLDGHVPAGPLKSFWLQDLNNKGGILGGLMSKNGDYCRAVLLEPIE